MRYTSRMKFNIHLAISIAVGLPIGFVYGSTVLAEEVQKKRAESECEKYSEVLPYLMTREYGMPLKAKVNKDIKIELNLTEEEAKHAISAINELDDISKNINYTILDGKNTSIKADIYMYSVENFQNSARTLGLTSFTYNESTGYINYPIEITLNKKCLKYKSENGVNLLNYVVKHEMMHTLGFADLYDAQYLDKSIMWYNTGADIDNFTDLDRYNIQKMYDDGEITIQKPSNSLFAAIIGEPNIIKKEKELEAEMEM